LPHGKETRYSFYKRLTGPLGPFGRFQEIYSLSEFDPRIFQTVASRYDFYGIPTHEYKEYHNNNNNNNNNHHHHHHELKT
jgi:hypothetical protein